jgi:hypothetical protein
MHRIKQIHKKFMQRPSYIARQIFKSLKSRYRLKAVFQNVKNVNNWDLWNTWKPFWG